MSSSRKQSRSDAQDHERFELTLKDVERQINGVKNWGEAEAKVLHILRQIAAEFHQVMDSGDIPDAGTQATARQRGSDLEYWIGKTQKTKYTTVRNDNLTRTYGLALDNWFKIGGRAVGPPSEVLDRILVEQGYIFNTYNGLSSAIQQFETRLEDVKTTSTEDPKKAISQLVALVASLNAEIKGVFQILHGRRREMRIAFRNLLPAEERSSKSKSKK